MSLTDWGKERIETKQSVVIKVPNPFLIINVFTSKKKLWFGVFVWWFVGCFYFSVSGFICKPSTTWWIYSSVDLLISVLQPALDFLMLLLTVKNKVLIMADQLSDLVKTFLKSYFCISLIPFEVIIVMLL